MIEIILIGAGLLIGLLSMVANSRANHHTDKVEDLGDEQAEHIQAGASGNVLVASSKAIELHENARTLWRILAALGILIAFLMIVIGAIASFIP